LIQMTEKYLVTGANGFIGSHLVDSLVAKKKSVRILVREKSNLENVEKHIRNKKVEVVKGELTNEESLKRAMQDCTVICNAAALTDLSASRKQFFNSNVQSLRNLLNIASSMNLRRFVHISSIGGFTKNHSLISEETPQSPINNYELSKVLGEKIALMFWEKHGLPITILEPSAVYGPRANMGFPYLLRMLKKRMMRYPVSESNLLNLVYVTDVVEAIELVIEKEEAIGERFIIGGKKSYTYKEIVEAASRELGISAPKKHISLSIAKSFALLSQYFSKIRGKKPELAVDYFDYITHDMVLDISKAKRILGYKPQVELSEGMREMVKWYLRTR